MKNKSKNASKARKKIPRINGDQMAKANPDLAGGSNASIDFRLATTECVNAGIAAKNSNVIWPRVNCRKEHWGQHVVLDGQIFEKSCKVENW
jgi:hypothetical protein